MRFLKQSTSVDVPIGPFLDDADGKTAETTLTLTQPDIRLKKNGAAWAQKAAAQTLSHEENGYYEVTLDATDTNTLGLLRLAVHESGALPIFEDFMVMPADVWDSLFGTETVPTILKRPIVRFTVGSGSTTTNIVTSSMDPAAGVTDQFKGRVVIFDKATTTANLRGQGTKISASTSGGELTVEALTTAPVSGDTGTIF